mmetsp:Transcript_51903/g.92580  ORF Transcript_51903/g.92580 Transcript_51903/m.92580 type:complete len:226 (-) Transcript_51903:8299-8976(-)
MEDEGDLLHDRETDAGVDVVVGTLVDVGVSVALWVSGVAVGVSMGLRLLVRVPVGCVAVCDVDMVSQLVIDRVLLPDAGEGVPLRLSEGLWLSRDWVGESVSVHVSLNVRVGCQVTVLLWSWVKLWLALGLPVSVRLELMVEVRDALEENPNDAESDRVSLGGVLLAVAEGVIVKGAVFVSVGICEGAEKLLVGVRVQRMEADHDGLCETLLALGVLLRLPVPDW